MPGTPSIQNAIPMPFFGTTPFAAPGLGIIASAIMLGFGLWWLARAERRGAPPRRGLRRCRRHGRVAAAADDPIVRERATTAREFDPGRDPSRSSQRNRTADRVWRRCRWWSCSIVNLVMSLLVLPRLDFSFLAEDALGRHFAVRRSRGVWAVMVALARAIATVIARQLAPPSVAAREHGCRRQCLGVAGRQRRKPGRLRRRGGGAARLRCGARLGARRSRAARWCRWRSPRTCWRLSPDRPRAVSPSRSTRSGSTYMQLAADRQIDPALVHHGASWAPGHARRPSADGAVESLCTGLVAACGAPRELSRYRHGRRSSARSSRWSR